ncbi:HAMP domain-containing sensor histidine kinase [Plantactinospora sp. BB1]|uniref:sensor histidine kinase n=1 Tax=Plantactinospora sp. BB1 TaxID=2071627 RepID=UPI000D17072E|nr:HAMP domain-containing sensor histidine kinase [Plantactinospora sp. BB1]AVT42092.1 histidine kinase [Plantactinospora sp. BB1]
MTEGTAAGAALLRLTLRAESDVFLVRQRGREVAAAVGMEHQDQVRLATALSEIGRYLVVTLPTAARAEVAFTAAVGESGATLVTEVSSVLPAGTSARTLTGALLVGRLVDTFDVGRDGDATVIRMTRKIPATTTLTPERLDVIRDNLNASAARTPLEEMAEQNEQLLAALEQTRAQRDELARLNAELAETNRGVLALYTQLSEELDETNRGVVALHAELEDRSVQLRTASEAKTRFLANVSHELRAPVTAVIGLTRLLLDPASDPLTAEQREQAELIRSSAADLLSLVNDLLDLGKAESGAIEPNWSEVELRAVFGQLRGTVRAMATRPEVQLVVVDPEPPAVIRTDEVLLTQVLRNLLHNGLKFTEYGEVRMTAEVADDSLVVRVRDTGIGIPAELQERIFEEFYQVPGHGSPTGARGTGLGLPYARRLSRLLGGDLRVASEPDRGSTFSVHLPLEPVP